MIIECPHCKSRVDGLVKGEATIPDDEYPFEQKAVLVVCPACRNPLLGTTELLQVDVDAAEWQNLYRQWPPRGDQVSRNIPDIARISLLEANVCFEAGAYSACAVMCGRTIEGVCVHYDPSVKLLVKGLELLKDRGIIDSRLFSWGTALRLHRNVGAHASAERISKEDARDLLDFATAICEYVFVLNEKFDRFQARQKKSKA